MHCGPPNQNFGWAMAHPAHFAAPPVLYISMQIHDLTTFDTSIIAGEIGCGLVKIACISNFLHGCLGIQFLGYPVVHDSRIYILFVYQELI